VKFRRKPDEKSEEAIEYRWDVSPRMDKTTELVRREGPLLQSAEWKR